MRTALALGAALTLGIGGCLGPLVDDELPSSVLPAGSVVPPPDDAVVAQIAMHSPVQGGLHPFTTGFRAGQSITYWDFGPVQGEPLPMYVLVDFTGAEVADHPPIVESVPGDPGYSPLCIRYTVRVGPEYVGQRMTSLAALRDARLADKPIVGIPEATDEVGPCPVVRPESRLELPDGEPLQPTVAFYRGAEVPFFRLASSALPSDGVFTEQYLAQLRREGGEPLREPHRQVDMTGDGDIRDTNDVWLDIPANGASQLFGLVRSVLVVVGANYSSIDTSVDETVADYTAAADLFSLSADGGLQPVVGNVVAWQLDDSAGVRLVASTEAGASQEAP